MADFPSSGAPVGARLPKAERVCGKTAVTRLVSGGKYGTLDHVRYCFRPGNGAGVNRIMVSVPKKFFKRAVRRNLLKRRLREAYRLNKGLLPAAGIDVLFTYISKEAVDFQTIYAEVETALREISQRVGGQE